MTQPTPQRWLVATTEYAGLTPYTGGIGRHYAALLPALVQLGVEVDLVVFADAPATPDVDLAGVRLVSYRILRRTPRLVALWLRALQLRRTASRRPYDAVFLPEWSALGSLLPRSAPTLTNLATSMRLSNEVSGFTLGDLPIGTRPVVLLQNLLETRQIRRSTGLVSISTAMLSWTRTRIDRLPPAVVVRNCIDVDAVRSAALWSFLPEHWPTDSAPVVLFLGRLERRKGITEAMAAFALLLESEPTARLVLAGASGDRRFEPDRTELLAMLPETAHSRVTWLGHVPGDELYRAVRVASVVVCPSRWEGFGNVALEVKAIGTPLVVTTGSGFDDFCSDDVDCLMVPPRRPDALARAMQRVLQEPGLGQRLADRASEGIAEFGPLPVAAALVDGAETLLASRRTTAS